MLPRSLFRTLQAYFAFSQALARDPRTPRLSKALPWLALLYAIMPLDVLPDFLPFIGQLDDLTIVPFLLFLAFWLIPKIVKRENKQRYVTNALLE